MKCPRCHASEISKNGRRSGRQNYLCKSCGRQFLESYHVRGYPTAVRLICMKMHKNGMTYREIEQLTGISHNTIILWVHQSQQPLSDSAETEEETDTFVTRSLVRARPTIMMQLCKGVSTDYSSKASNAQSGNSHWQ